MDCTWIDAYLTGKKGVTRNLQADWNWERYYVGDKMFAAVCRDPADKPVFITLKLEPLEGAFWRGQYEDIIPGYYMNKTHWNSVKADGNVPEDILRLLLDKAWETGFQALSKKKQKELSEGKGAPGEEKP